MTLFIDSSALFKRYVTEEGSSAVSRLMEEDPDWTASALCRPETQIALCRTGYTSEEPTSFRNDWERFLVIPLDDACLARAVEIGCDYGVRTLDAIHLAAAERIPPPVSVLTFDDRQRTAAEALGLTLAA